MAAFLGARWGAERMETENGSWSARLRSVQQVRTGPSGLTEPPPVPFALPGSRVHRHESETSSKARPAAPWACARGWL